MTVELWLWRHPRAVGAAGRCIGRTDLAVDPRRAKRLAHSIRRAARLNGLPREVTTSPLRRCADVGRWLRRWGWRHRVDAALVELDFGRWEGLRWVDIDRAEVDAWCDDFAAHRPGGGESVLDLFERIAAWRAEGGMVVAHAGWITAMRLSAECRPAPTRAADWPLPPPCATCVRITLKVDE